MRRVFSAVAVVAVVAAAIVVPAAPAATGRLVTFTRSGGFVGVHSQIVVWRDGRITGDRKLRLSAAKLAELRTALVAARFATLEREYGDPCCDKFAYTTTYRGRTVTVYDPARPPARLQRVLRILLVLVGRG